MLLKGHKNEIKTGVRKM